MPVPKPAEPPTSDPFFDDDEGWQDMPVVRDDFANGLDEEDKKRYHYVTPEKSTTVNATGNLIDVDYSGQEWREKQDTNESEYTRLRLTEENENDEVHLRTKFLFDEDKAMTPLSQMQATKDMLTEAQRIAYVGLCALLTREMAVAFKKANAKELKPAIESLELWALKIMGRLYYHMELETQEQKMIESLAEHGVQAADLVPSLMTTHTVANPEYDPAEAKGQEEARKEAEAERIRTEEGKAEDITDNLSSLPDPANESKADPKSHTTPSQHAYQTTANVLPKASETITGVTTSLSAADKNVTLDIRWTILCDLFLVLIADSVYDARSRVLLEATAFKLGLGWQDIVKFEQRVTEALEIQEGVEKLEQKEVMEGRAVSSKRRRYAMIGLATIGGGLVIGLSAGLLAPMIGAGFGTAFTAIGLSGTSTFLAGTGGAAVITTAGTLTGSGIAARGMARRSRSVRTFDLLPLHNNKRVNCIVTVSGFMTSAKDDVRLPFSVLDPVVGDVFSVLWEPEMLGEAGSALKILTSEVLSSVGQTVLQTTVMAALMSALQWPILLTKLGYLIDNPWSNAMDRAKAAGAVLADVLIRRHLGVRPITLIGFSLGARVIFYCLLELARKKAFGIVQDVFILGATFTATRSAWLQARSVVSGRFVNGFARNDWVLNYLFRATNAGLQNIAGLRPVLNIPGLENVDVTDKIAGHMSYRAFMPLILDQLGFPVSADYFDEPEEPDMKVDRMVVRESEEASKKKGWFSRGGKGKDQKVKYQNAKSVTRPPSTSWYTKKSSSSSTASPLPGPSSGGKGVDDGGDGLPERLEGPSTQWDTASTLVGSRSNSPSNEKSKVSEDRDEATDEDDIVPARAGFNIEAMKEIIAKSGGTASTDADVLHAPAPRHLPLDRLPLHQPLGRTESAPPPLPSKTDSPVSFNSDRDRSATPTSHVRNRVASAPGLNGEGEFDEAVGFGLGKGRSDLASAYGRSVSLSDAPSSQASGSTSSSGAAGFGFGLGPGTGADEVSDLSSEFGRTRLGGTGNNTWAAEESDGDDDGFGGYQASSFGSPYGGMSGASRMGGLGAGFGPADSSATLTFGGAGGSIWDTGDTYGTGMGLGPGTTAGGLSFSATSQGPGSSGPGATASSSASASTSFPSHRGSDAFGASSSMLSGPVGPGLGLGSGSGSGMSAFNSSMTPRTLAVSSPPPELPPDMLNPFAASQVSLASAPAGGLSFGAADGSLFVSPGLGLGSMESGGSTADSWTPPPLSIGRGAAASGSGSGDGRGSLRRKQSAAASSMLNVNANPWG